MKGCVGINKVVLIIFKVNRELSLLSDEKLQLQKSKTLQKIYSNQLLQVTSSQSENHRIFFFLQNIDLIRISRGIMVNFHIFRQIF